jgi:hypothetical protein
MLKTYYEDIENQLNQMIINLAKILKIEGREKPLMINVLKIIQDNNEKIFEIDYKKYKKIW